MLKLKNITKTYELGDVQVHALKGVSLCFRKSEFVSILGPSGCGKTTMLNIIGGLDRYTNGDLVINGTSTKEYKDKDWDTYRNHSIGFVFQSYNLIPHQTVLENVELALTLSGVSSKERKKRAADVLVRVGLGDKLNNKPSQLSGGQMQRVAIARALVNDPEIILADEPTGALDTETSVQIMDILKEISKDKLIIMVTHNPDLAEKYSTRIVNLLDGLVTGDSNPYSEEDEQTEVNENLQKKIAVQMKEGRSNREIQKREKKKRMSFWTALSLSFKNLLTKKARTILVAFAGSIGIIGIALILAVSSGFSTYINKMQEDTLSSYPITIQSKKVDFMSVVTSMFLNSSSSSGESHPDGKVYPKENISNMINSVGDNLGTNNLEKFYKYVNDHNDEIKDYINGIQCTYDLGLEVYKDSDHILTTADLTDFLTNKNVEPNSNAIMQMVIKYALYYFENKTRIGFEEKPDGTYDLLRPTDLGEYITDADDEVRLAKMKEAYPFIYDNNYTELIPIAEALEDPANEGRKNLPKMTVISLVFSVMDLNVAPSSFGTTFGSMSIFSEMLDNEEFIKSQYKLLAGKFAMGDETHADEALLVLDKNSALDDYVLYGLGILNDTEMGKILKGLITGDKYNCSIDYADIVGTNGDGIEYRMLDAIDYFVVDSDDGFVDFRIYNKAKNDDNTDNTLYNPSKYYGYLLNAYNNCTNTIKIVGIVRLNDTTKNGALSAGVVYNKYFTQQMIKYRNDKIDAFVDGGNTVTGISKINTAIPKTISIYINSFKSKDNVKDFINKYNAQADKNDQITYTDYVDLIMSTVSTIINAITYVLIAFVSVSLLVSSIMIGIITYISVIERTKEIGVLRSVGASKRDVKRVFTAESFIIGLASGVLGIVVSLILILPINLVLGHFTGIAGLASLPVIGSLVLIAISVVLTLISGLIPAKAAAKKDPVIALREN